MRDTTRQKYLDAMNRRGDLIQQADAAFADGNVEKGIDLTNQAAALNPEIEGYRNLIDQEEKFAGMKAPALDREVRDFVFSFRQTHEFMAQLEKMITFLLPLYSEEGKTVLVIGIGCTGGHHRSVAVAHELAEYITQMGYQVTENHRDISR